MSEIRAIGGDDFRPWCTLAEAYESFYGNVRQPHEYVDLWMRLHSRGGIHALGCYLGGDLAGFAHYLFHASCWAADVCYLQDLFVAPEQRRHGLGSALIGAVVAEAKGRGASRLYWHTQADNRIARALYDRVGSWSGFIRYERNLA